LITKRKISRNPDFTIDIIITFSPFQQSRPQVTVLSKQFWKLNTPLLQFYMNTWSEGTNYLLYLTGSKKTNFIVNCNLHKRLILLCSIVKPCAQFGQW